MNEAAFLDNLNKCGMYLKKLELLKRENLINTKRSSYRKFSVDFVECSRKEPYFNVYRCALENDDYDFLLIDGSFFQFSIDFEAGDENVRMAYYPSICNIQYSDFLYDQFGVTEDMVGAEFMELYHLFLIEQSPQNVTPVRYDYNVNLYEEKIHSAAHIHFGYEENLRIPIDKQLRPVLFAKIIVEYFFYDLWKKKIKEGDSYILYGKRDYEELDSKFFGTEDMRIPHMHFKETL